MCWWGFYLSLKVKKGRQCRPFCIYLSLLPVRSLVLVIGITEFLRSCLLCDSLTLAVNQVIFIIINQSFLLLFIVIYCYLLLFEAGYFIYCHYFLLLQLAAAIVVVIVFMVFPVFFIVGSGFCCCHTNNIADPVPTIRVNIKCFEIRWLRLSCCGWVTSADRLLPIVPCFVFLFMGSVVTR